MTEEKLRALLEQAEEVGYARREWQEAIEGWRAMSQHPRHRREMETAECVYREARAALYAAAGIPEEANDVNAT